jgi:hypothetical protein
LFHARTREQHTAHFYHASECVFFSSRESVAVQSLRKNVNREKKAKILR